MKALIKAAATPVAAVLLWAVFSWPAALEFGRAIPSSLHNVGREAPREMIPGDHLQFLYHYELVGDMLAGRIPWFHNVYEFNTGDDAARFRATALYAPFSFVFAAWNALAGPAAAWNLTHITALWIALAGLRRLIGACGAPRGVELPVSLVACALTYPWFVFLSGSPTGAAMAWVPWILWGAWAAIGRARPGPAVVAGLAILFSAWSDKHVLYFSLLLFPVWCALAWIAHVGASPRTAWAQRARAIALWPAAAGIGGGVLYTWITGRSIRSSTMAGGRTLRELLSFSPQPDGIVRWHLTDHMAQVFLGFALLTALLLAAGMLVRAAFRRDRPEPARRMAWAGLGALACLAACALVAVSPHGGRAGRFLLTQLREYLPAFQMIRQTGKVFSLAPSLIAVSLAFGWAAADGASPPWRRRLRITWIALLALALVEFRIQYSPTLCLLNPHQSAYAAVRNDTPADRPPRALVVPLWPGDAHFTSVYQFHAARHGIRMVNGYSPVVPQGYIEDVFERWQSVNQGVLSDDQIDALLDRGIGHILLHEDLFPEKVSAFPAGSTLRRLLAHPRVERIESDSTVHAFRLLPHADGAAGGDDGWAIDFPARRWEFEAFCPVSGRDGDDTGFATLGAGDAPVRARATRALADDATVWMARVRGRGSLTAITTVDAIPVSTQTVAIASDEWTWRVWPVGAPAAFGAVGALFDVAEGELAADMLLLARGPIPADGRLVPPLEIPAARMFRAGSTNPDGRSVTFRRAHDPRGPVLYGPKLPLAPGRYEVEMVFESPASDGVVLGRFNLRFRDDDERGWVDVIAGRPARTTWAVDSTLPVNLVFDYTRAADLVIRTLRFTPAAP